MVLNQLIKKLESSKVFKEWNKTNRDYYLVHAFLMIDPNIKAIWQVGYYNKRKDRIVTFDVDEEILQNPESEVFKKSGIINKLELSKVKVSHEKAINIAKKFAKNYYPTYKIEKMILILQNLDKQLWNITFISNSFETLNIKIDASNGKVLYHNLTKIFSLDTNISKTK